MPLQRSELPFDAPLCEHAAGARASSQAGERAIGPKIVAAVTLTLLALIASLAYFERDYEKLAHTLERDRGVARDFRWERPVLRGAMGNGNAADDVYAALAEWQPLEPTTRRDLAWHVYFGQTPTAAQTAALSQRATALRALRASVQQGWSHTDLALERGTRMLVPDYARAEEAALGLLAEARSKPPLACLQEAADVIRIGQDLVPSAPLEAVVLSARLDTYAGRVIAHCALHADLAALRTATHELRVLATHPPPIGSCLETEALAATAELEQHAAVSGKGPGEVLSTLMERPSLLAAWARRGSAARLRQILPEHYPDSLEELRRERDLRGLRSADAASREWLRIQEDVRGQAQLRMLAVAIAALAERAYRGTLSGPPNALLDAFLADPFRGKPFQFSMAPNGAEFSLWSVGADLRDDGGAEDWTETGPRDVTLHVALR